MKFAKLATVLVVLGMVFSLTGTAGADSSTNSLTNQAVVAVTGHYQDSQDLAWSLAQVSGPEVTAVNEATATATDCETCTAEAVAFQVVLASDTQVYALTNTATSLSTECVNCTTVSVAEQWVVGDTDQELRLNLVGQLELWAIHWQLALWSHVPPAQGLPHILDLANQVSAILAADVVEVPLPQATASAAVTTLAQPAPRLPTVQHFAQVSG